MGPVCGSCCKVNHQRAVGGKVKDMTAGCEAYVHEWQDQYGRWWWVVAALEDGLYSAPVCPSERRAWGGVLAFGNLELAAAVGYRYRRRQDAMRRAKIEYGWQDEEGRFLADVERRALVGEA